MTDPSQPLKTLFDLTGQVAIVTGGSRGPGFQMAEALGAHGEYVTTPDQFLPALQRAYDIAKTQGIPSVINCQAKKEFWLREFAPGFLGKTEPGITSYYH